MVERIEIGIRRLRRKISRSHFLARVLGLYDIEKQDGRKGLVMIQIDALPKSQLEKAMNEGRTPFLKSLLQNQKYKLVTHYSGIPISTAAVQAELFYGVKSAVPAFSFLDSETGRVFAMFNPQDAQEIEQRLEEKNLPLLQEGSAYSNIYTGGAKEAHFCISSLGFGNIIREKHPLGFSLLLLMNLYGLVRTAALMVVETGLAVYDSLKGLIRGKDLAKELKFVPSRVAICVLLRELITFGAKTDIARGLPIIHVNLMGYHEQSHRRGATSGFAHWTLLGIDDAVKRIWSAAHRSVGREYEVWIYSDHGQVDTVPYERKFGRSIQEAVDQASDETEDGIKSVRVSRKIGFLARAGLRKPGFFSRLFQVDLSSDDKPIVCSFGPVGHIYFRRKMSEQEKDLFIQRLITQAGIPMVMIPQENGILMRSANGTYHFPEQAELIMDTETPYFEEMKADFLEACRKPNCGDLLIYGKTNGEYYTFAVENGSHGGFLRNEAEGFALLPEHEVGRDKQYFRTSELRSKAMDLLGRSDNHKAPAKRPSSDGDQLRIMTYNVHGCVGMDGVLSPHRIAKVILQYEPDVIALQELDMNRMRSGGQDQAAMIAELLNMEHHFNPAMQIVEESFGDAVLSAHPMKLIRADSLSRHKRFESLEPRGAIWITVNAYGRQIQLFNTHLGLAGPERILHASELLGENWMGRYDCTGPFLLCGDFNAVPGSRVFQILQKRCQSAQMQASRRHRVTWFGRYPIACLDHIFVSDDLEVLRVEVGDSHLCRLASDHRPLIVDIRLPG